MRIWALSEAGVIYIMTHDSIVVGENGRTHQPIEHLMNELLNNAQHIDAPSCVWQ